jgi:peptide/nickel transport system permease protein
VRQAVPVSIELAILALFIGVAMGISLGIVSSVSRGSAVDYLASLISTIGITVPSFVIGLVVLLVGVEKFSWIPPTRYAPLTDDIRSNAAQFTIPALILAFALAAGIARITRSSMLEVLNGDYIRTARAKGLQRLTVLRRHAFRNALIPIITVIGLQLAAVLGGSVVMESLFNLPGLGRLVLNGIRNRDYPVVQGGVLVIVCFVVLVNLLVDLSYGLIDPRTVQK